MVDSNDEGGFSWLKCLNPKDRKYYMSALASAHATAIDFKWQENQKASEKIAWASLSKRG